MTDTKKLEEIQEELHDKEGQPLPANALITDQKSEDQYFTSLIAQTASIRDELMQPVDVSFMGNQVNVNFLTKAWLILHQNSWIHAYMNKLNEIHIKNPILIKTNQETALELEEAIKNATTEREEIELKKTLASTLEQIGKLKNSIAPEATESILSQFVEILMQLKTMIAAIEE